MLNKDKNPSWYLPNDSDPFLDMLKTYDIILGNIMKINYPFILATGMSQKLNGTKEFYYRLKNHKEFFKLINLNFISCNTRMSRDCEIIFNSNHDRDEAYNILSNIREEQTKTLIFNEIEIREKSLFVILTYPKEIKKDSSIVINKKSIKLVSHVVFVAIKNGKHQSKGFAFFSESLKDIIPNQNAHVSELFNLIEQFFGLGSIKK